MVRAPRSGLNRPVGAQRPCPTVGRSDCNTRRDGPSVAPGVGCSTVPEQVFAQETGSIFFSKHTFSEPRGFPKPLLFTKRLSQRYQGGFTQPYIFGTVHPPHFHSPEVSSSAKCTVMGGQQVCNQACRPCNDG